MIYVDIGGLSQKGCLAGVYDLASSGRQSRV